MEGRSYKPWPQSLSNFGFSAIIFAPPAARTACVGVQAGRELSTGMASKRAMSRSLLAAIATTVLIRRVCCAADAPAAAPANQTRPPALFVFGDSLIDSGNNNNLASLAKANYFPYGIDFAAGPTGRFCNGYTIVDELGKCACLNLWVRFLQASYTSCNDVMVRPMTKLFLFSFLKFGNFFKTLVFLFPLALWRFFRPW